MAYPWTGDTIYLDTNVVIFAIEQNNQWSGIIRELFQAIDERAVHAFTSELPLAEILVKPIAVGANDLVDKYNHVLASDSIIRVVPMIEQYFIQLLQFGRKIPSNYWTQFI
jgi:hypothetical protein